MTTRLGTLVLVLLAGCGGTAHNAAPPAAAPPTPVAAATPATAVTEPLPADPAGPKDAAEPAEPVDQAPPAAADPAPTDGIGPGQPGTIGYGSRDVASGGGSAKPSKPPVAEVVPGAPEVRGALDKELIRRIVRRHLTEVKFCYEKERTRNPALQGRITLQFTIAPTGAVATSIVQSTTLGNPSVEQCFAGAIRRWEFPKPQGGVVVVTYPFVLKVGTE